MTGIKHLAPNSLQIKNKPTSLLEKELKNLNLGYCVEVCNSIIKPQKISIIKAKTT